MNLSAKRVRQERYLPHSVGVLSCPACGDTVQAGAARCSFCGFTGADSMKIFTAAPPRLLPVSDLASILPSRGVRKIEATLKRLHYRFPQFHWRVMTVALPRDVNPSLFGFWLLNAAPLEDQESPEQRAWTILLVIDTISNQAAVIPGYAAEPYISDEIWKEVLSKIALPWTAGKPTAAIIGFLKKSLRQLELARKRYSVMYLKGRSK
jgi:hypothetical protein